MVSLNDDYLTAAQAFNEAGIQVPIYDQRQTTIEGTEHPRWVHFGGGNLFRCFHALVAQDLIEQGEMTGGVIVAETYDDEVISDMYHKYGNRFVDVIMNNDGTFDKQLVASVAESIYYNVANKDGWQRMTDIFENPELQLATMSITEKGYALHNIDGSLTDMAAADIANGPEAPKTNMGAIAHLLYARYQAGAYPIAMVSTDNFSQNGKTFQNGVMTIANGWHEQGLVDDGFIAYLNDPQKVSFPWTMIDRITPNPAENVGADLKENGFANTTILHTTKHTNIAPFANTEEVKYLVMEDNFPNGRPAFEKAGVMMVDRETVNDADQMKVTACLNPLHTALAIYGCLLGYTSIYDEVQDDDVVALIKNLGYGEDLPVVKDPKVINPRKFLAEFIDERLQNKNVPDMPQRIATDTSQKMSVRYGVTLSHYIDDPQRNPATLEFIPLVIAGWCRYLTGIGDDGKPFTLSRDPLMDQLQASLKGIELGATQPAIHQALQPIISNKEIFTYDLYAIGLGDKVERDFEQLIAAPGAVRKTLHEMVTTKNYSF